MKLGTIVGLTFYFSMCNSQRITHVLRLYNNTYSIYSMR